ncbi:hypothetical protein KOW79_019322 [Hemibagrus wyckioides]|uniref:Uncharacterized protein n=1 Tax=Hemibagrus wyckioides TaxID=337641 RepID=A0A9D3N972_9TELE|nr:hypothetical protein KOW79_019322 [Hemibagrus wyckioides]
MLQIMEAIAFSFFPTSPNLKERTLVQKGAGLTPSQNEYLTELVYRFADVLRSNPAKSQGAYLGAERGWSHSIPERVPDGVGVLVCGRSPFQPS